MLIKRPLLLLGVAALLNLLQCTAPPVVTDDGVPRKFLRFAVGPNVSYGILEGDRVRRIDGNLFGDWQAGSKTYALSEIELLVPTIPSKVLAMAGNYRSHIDSEQIPPKFAIPQVFYKNPSCLIAQGQDIVIPPGADPVHYEAEMVIVIGKRANRVPRQRAMEHVFGVTCGNDISARNWQKSDVQWWRAKASDTFGPCGPVIATGIDYDNLKVVLRHNGQVRQSERTSRLIHDVATMVSFISHHVTLEPGDLIFTGTSGETDAIKATDVVEVEIEGVGVLRNRVVAD